jgi:hypothetical protein
LLPLRLVAVVVVMVVVVLMDESAAGGGLITALLLLRSRIFAAAGLPGDSVQGGLQFILAMCSCCRAQLREPATSQRCTQHTLPLLLLGVQAGRAPGPTC